MNKKINWGTFLAGFLAMLLPVIADQIKAGNIQLPVEFGAWGVPVVLAILVWATKQVTEAEDNG